jgi:hypothetical protein
VTINAPADVTVLHDAGTTTVKSLTLSDSLNDTAGSLTVTGTLSVASGRTLQLNNIGTRFTASNVSNLDGVQLRVNGGAVAELGGIIEVTNTVGDMYWDVTGGGSVLRLPDLVRINDGEGRNWDVFLRAFEGGELDLSSVRELVNPNSGDQRDRSIQVYSEGLGSVIKLHALQNVYDYQAYETSDNDGEYSRLEPAQGGVIELGNLTSVRGVYIPLDGLSRIIGGTLEILPTSWVTGQGEIISSIRNSGGTVTVGKLPGGLTIIGDYTQTGTGRLVITVDGPVQDNNYSQLIIDGKATLAGTLEITRANNFAPDLFTDYAIVAAETITGTFSSVTGGTITGGNLAPQYGSSVVALSRSFDRMPIATFPYQNSLPNQRTFFNVSQVAGGRAEFRIYDPSGKLVGLSNATPTNPNFGDFGPFLLKDVGTYEVRVYGALGESPTFVAAPNAAPLAAQPGFFRKATNGDIPAPGATQVWEFDARAGDETSLDVLNIVGAGQQLSFTLKDPDGRVVFHRKATTEAFNEADFGPFFATMGGVHTLTVDGVGDDAAAYQFLVSGPQAPRVRSHALKGPNATTVNEAWFLFDQSMDTMSFSIAADLLTFQNPSGPVAATGFRWQDPTTLVITFAPQPSDVPLFMALSPTILNAAGVALDQDGDRIPGEVTDDQYLAELIVDNRGPFVIHTQPGTTASAPIDRVTFHFNEPIDAATFSLADVTQFTGPGNVDLRSQLTNFLVGDESVTVFFTEQEAGGQFTIAIGPNIADAAGNLMDDAFTLTTNVQSPDLIVTNVTNPTPATHGQDLTLTWTVQNIGGDPATGPWWDYVYVSADDKWDLNDALVGTVLYTGPALAANGASGSSYNRTLTAPLPGVLPGDYRIIVRTNLLQNLTEATQDDNTRASAAAARFDLPALTSGVVATRNVDFREELYYKFEVAANMAGGSLILRLGTSNTSVANELYVRRNALPTRSTYDARSQQGLASNQYLILSSLKAGTYYILGAITPDQQVGPNTPLGTANLQADLLVPGEFTVLDSNFGQGGTAGNRTIEINGVNFDRTLTATLTNGAGASIPAISYYRVGPEELYATFDLTSVTPGTYNVVLENSAGQVETIGNSMEVVAGGGASIQPLITAPPAFRPVFHAPLVHYPISVSWENVGLNDAPVPIIAFDSNEPFGEVLTNVLAGNGTNSITFFGLPNDRAGIPGVLMPGKGNSITYYVVPRLAQEVSINEDATYTLEFLFSDATHVFDWEDYRALLYEPSRNGNISDYLTAEEFDATFDAFKIAAGSTTGDFTETLTSAFTLLPTVSADFVVGELALVQEAFYRFAASVNTSIFGKVVYSAFDIDLTKLTVTARNTTTSESFEAPVRQDGSFVFPRVDPGQYELTVAGGAVTTEPHVIINVTDSQSANPLLPIIRGGSVVGSITTASRGQPVDDASITLVSESLNLAYFTTSAEDGSFDFLDVHPGDYKLLVNKDTYVRTESILHIDIGESHVANQQLLIGATVSGAVVMHPLGAPIADAKVLARRLADGATEVSTTNNLGQYSIGGLANGQWELVVSHPNFVASNSGLIDVVTSPPVTRDFQLVAGGTIEGFVRTESALPVVGAVVSLQVGEASLGAVTGADGAYRITGISPGSFQLLVAADAFATLTTSIESIEAG